MSGKLNAIVFASLLLGTMGSLSAEGLGAHPPMFLIQAENALESGDSERAIELLHRRYKRLLSPEDRVRGFATLCRAFLAEHNLRRASWACTRATDADLAGWSDFNNRGVLQLHLGRFNDALASFERARTLNPESEPVRNNLMRTRAIIDTELVSSAR